MPDQPPPQTSKSAKPSPKVNENLLTAAKGGGIMFGGRMAAYASRFVITFLLARLLGAEQFGLYTLARLTATIAGGLALFGLNTALVRFVAAYTSRKDEAGLWGTLQIGLGFATLLSLGIALGLYLLSTPIAVLIFKDPQLAPLLKLASFAVPFLTLNDIIASATQGFKKMQYTVITQNIFTPLFRLILIVILIIVGLNAALALVIFAFVNFVSVILVLYFLNKLFPLRRPLRDARWDTKEILSFSLPVYLSDLMVTFRGNIQTVLLGALNTVTSVGIFTVASRVNLASTMFHNSLLTAARPIMAQLDDQGDRIQLESLYQTTTKWVLTLNLPVFLIMVLFPAPILSLFGKSFVGGATALAILAWANLVDAGTGMCGGIIDMTGHTRLKLLNSATNVVLSLGLNILLIPQWGMVGAAISSLIVVAIVNGMRLVQVFVLFRIVPYNLSFLKPVAASLIALAVSMLLASWIAVELSFIYLVVQALIIFTVYTGVTLLLGFSPEERAMLVRLRRRSKKVFSRS